MPPLALHNAPPTHSALAASLFRLRRRWVRTTLVMLALCPSIAFMLNAFALQGIGVKLLYSFAIGLSCWFISEAGTLLQAGGSDLLRQLRGLPPHADGYDHGWRGKVAPTIACVLGGPPLGTWVGDAITGFRSAPLWQLSSDNSRITVAVAVLGSVLVVSIVSSMERLASARAQAEAAQRLASETQLRLLQSQLEPHMLFNTLANLRVLIGLDAVRAQQMLDHLIAFLRATLAASRSGTHALASEFERIADYLALMAVRMGPRLQVQLALPADLRTLHVPPLLLQPLVENSIQHGLEPQVDGGRVEVSAWREAEQLVLCVRDTGIGRTAAAAAGTSAAVPGAPGAARQGGFGLAGIRERLHTLYGERASLDIDDAPGGGTRVTLRLPLAALAAPTTPSTP